VSDVLQQMQPAGPLDPFRPPPGRFSLRNRSKFNNRGMEYLKGGDHGTWGYRLSRIWEFYIKYKQERGIPFKKPCNTVFTTRC
jgi:hypothetical protein